ncbi:MAG: tRNA adenosine(34) deaminase TadA [Candidatus Rickettsiella isopodorum]|jgi:tRNA(adenine34) deaminase|nr:tRNA adenosine(34) deaminase TadA [Gammaproteobacteria bacterium]MCH9754432.1 tRNA adenosine(34) deaminase TadA [Gammaproteobacteria bacterium]MDD5161833.1 tRNA adenosine(34) deaminase TadA [Candidatus Rickettsiella isopodorum]MDQ5900106.1 tRNA(adenine34) deaminase [Pseudomonadota bacterium]
MNFLQNDKIYMKQALKAAELAEMSGEVPVGAVLVLNKQIICTAYNQTLTHCDPTAHAEVLLLQQAAKQLKNHRLLETTLYVTLEPCLMCVGAMIQARIKRLVFGAYDTRFGVLTNQWHLFKALNHTFTVTDGVLTEVCAEKLQQFFKHKRQFA